MDEETSGIIAMERLIDKAVNACRWLDGDTDVTVSGRNSKNQNATVSVKFFAYVDNCTAEVSTPVLGPTFCPHEPSETCLFMTVSCL